MMMPPARYYCRRGAWLQRCHHKRASVAPLGLLRLYIFILSRQSKHFHSLESAANIRCSSIDRGASKSVNCVCIHPSIHPSIDRLVANLSKEPSSIACSRCHLIFDGHPSLTSVSPLGQPRCQHSRHDGPNKLLQMVPQTNHIQTTQK
jgi:hypothetical protein